MMSREYTRHIDQLAESYDESQREETLAHIRTEIEFARSLICMDETPDTGPGKHHRREAPPRTALLSPYVFCLGRCCKCNQWQPLRYATPFTKARNNKGLCGPRKGKRGCWPGIWTGPSYFCIKESYKKWPLPRWFKKWIER